MSHALEGRFLTTGPPGKFSFLFFNELLGTKSGEERIICKMRKESFSSSKFLSQVPWLLIVGYQNREEFSFWL